MFGQPKWIWFLIAWFMFYATISMLIQNSTSFSAGAGDMAISASTSHDFLTLLGELWKTVTVDFTFLDGPWGIIRIFFIPLNVAGLFCIAYEVTVIGSSAIGAIGRLLH